MKDILFNLNLFESILPSSDANILRNQKRSTKLFLILFISSMCIIILYTSLVVTTKTIYFENPTLEKYSQLYALYSEQLTCSCNKISINYKKFMSVAYTLHQVCANDLTSGKWLEHMSGDSNRFVFEQDEFPSIAPATFQALAALCQLINRTIWDSQNRFYLNQYISTSVTPKHVLESQTDSFAHQFRSSTTDAFLLSLDMIRNTTQANGLVSSLQTNYQFYRDSSSSSILTYAKSYSHCDCSIDQTCVKPAGFKNRTNSTIYFVVPGIYTGCYPMEGILQSSLECFYNEECIDNVMSKTLLDSSIYPAVLDSSLQTQYLPNTSVKLMLDQLMIEQWNKTIIYEGYYEECQPYECTYILKHRNNAIYIVTTVIGLMGGLVTVLKLITPLVIRLIQKRHRRNTLEPGKKLIHQYSEHISFYLSTS